jgi:hypothetical protein
LVVVVVVLCRAELHALHTYGICRTELYALPTSSTTDYTQDR